MATYWVNSCSFGLRNVFLVSVPDCWFGFSHLGFWSGNLFLITPFPDLVLLAIVSFHDKYQFESLYTNVVAIKVKWRPVVKRHDVT